MNLRWTDAGRAALASAAHVGVAAVKLTHLAIGDGQGAGGAADDNRTALRSERHRAALSGAAAIDKIAARADFNLDATYGITEAGVFGTAGSPETPELYLYWSDSGTEAGKAAKGTALAIAAVIEFPGTPADVTVTVGGTIKFGNVDPATEAAFGSTRYATAAETEAGTAADRSVTPKGLHSAAGKLAAALFAGTPADGTVYQLKGAADGKLIVEKRALPAATTNQKGIVELATGDEAKKGTDSARAVTPAGLKAATDALNVPAAPASATTSKKGIVELATGDEAKKGTDSARAVTPAALKAATDALNVPAAPASATTSKKGIVELATGDETKKGTDATRAVTPKGLKANLLAPLVPAAGATDKTYVIQRASSGKGGGLKIVEAVFRRYVTPGSHKLTVPAGVTRLRFTLVGAGGGGGSGNLCGEVEEGFDGDSVETSTFCDDGSAGSAGGLSAVRRAGVAIASAAGGAAGRGGTESSNWDQPGGSPGGAAGGKGGGGSGGAGGGRHLISGLLSYAGGNGEGGAAGAVKTVVIAVTPGEVLSIVCGAGGAGGSAGEHHPNRGSVISSLGGGPGRVGAAGMVKIVNA